MLKWILALPRPSVGKTKTALSGTSVTTALVCVNCPTSSAATQQNQLPNCWMVTAVTVKQNGSKTLAGACFSNTGSGSLDDTFYRNLMKNRTEQSSFMCGSTHHDGDLCGRCEDGYYLMAYSYNLSCVRCENAHRNWLLYFAVGYGPLTLFYFLVVFFKLSVNTSSLHGFIFVSQAFSMPAYTRLILHSTRGTTQTSMKVLSALYGIWNLDFVRAFTTGICLKIDSLSILALDYGIAVFPLLLTLLSYCLIELHDRNFRVIVFIWKPFRHLLMLFRHNWNSRTSVGRRLLHVLYSVLHKAPECFIRHAGPYKSVHVGLQ